jgi:hypothetical protein
MSKSVIETAKFQAPRTSDWTRGPAESMERWWRRLSGLAEMAEERNARGGVALARSFRPLAAAAESHRHRHSIAAAGSAMLANVFFTRRGKKPEDVPEPFCEGDVREYRDRLVQLDARTRRRRFHD